jgi:SAM-dependent methyltransferase
MTLGLDIGCGENKHTEIADKVLGLDIRGIDGVDIIWDINQLPLWLNPDMFDAVIMDNILEHVNPDSFVDLMSEIWRIMKTGATFTIIVPHHTNPTSLEPEHRLRFSMDSLSCIDDQYKNTQTMVKRKFRLISRSVRLIAPFGWLSRFFSDHKDLYEYRFCYFMPAKDVTFVFKKV